MQTLKEGAHIVYIVGFQAGGGVYMDAKYSGPDTDNNKILMLSGVASSRYFSKCTPASLSPAAGVPPIQADAPVEYSPFTICLFKSEVGGLSQTPRIGDAVAFNQISYVGKGSVPIVDLHDLANFRQYVPGTPEANYVWAIYGSLRTVTPGNYNLCISSDDGCLQQSSLSTSNAPANTVIKTTSIPIRVLACTSLRSSMLQESLNRHHAHTNKLFLHEQVQAVH
jgi:hypothetical protein